jgi:DNA polymerase-1
MLKERRFPGQEKNLRLYRSIATMDRKAPLPALDRQTPTWSQAAAIARDWSLNNLAERIEQLAEEAAARN